MLPVSGHVIARKIYRRNTRIFLFALDELRPITKGLSSRYVVIKLTYGNDIVNKSHKTAVKVYFIKEDINLGLVKIPNDFLVIIGHGAVIEK